MAGEWREVSLWDIAHYINGRATKPSELCGNDGVPVIKIAELNRGITEQTDRIPAELIASEHWVKDGDLLFAWSGSVGIYRYRGPKAALNQHIFKVIAKPGYDQLFVRYLLLSQMPIFEAHVEDKKTTMGHVTVRDLQRIKVRVPPLPEQRAIAHILGTLDDKIELNRRMSETLEEMARALFKAWFVDFEPVRAKMEGRWRRGQSLPGLPAHLYDLFPNRLVDSELGEIPEGWRVVTLPELIEINPSRSLRKGEVAPYLDMANMPTRGHTPDGVINRPFSSGMRFINGDTLLARITPCLENGKTAFVDFLEEEQVGWGSTEYIVLRPKPPLPEQFGYCLARSDAFREFAIQSMTGTSGRQRVQADSLSHFKLPRPPDPVAAAFGRLIKPLFARSSDAVRESRTLAALRDALLPKLISGQLRVRDAERFLKERGL
ncbi:restriction endonuclease subunit S [Candidatus Roseilinea sp. NK_OTU-006]|jgi:type I restriction enzyme S subunit|uniref:restriction endonuclease subunit S n=1 Tax=Candidatus Roseilinea sp. NK_OTU-006 TaxID=2704250 RepID=UPI00145F4BDB|nr:restriction endonuclease subunit S [Candidatus Roseilinea sp. NK_OTU-006]